MIFIILIIIAALFSFLLYKNYINPPFLMSALWAIILIICVSGIMPYYPVSDRTYLVITVGVLAFCVGCAFGATTKITLGKPSYQTNTEESSFCLNYKLVFALEIFTALLMLPEVLNSITLLRAGADFDTIRENASQGISVFSNPIILLFRNYITNPFLIIVYPLAAYTAFTTTGKMRIGITAMAAAICLEHVFYQGGRVPLVYFILHFILMMVLLKKSFHISKKVKRRLLIVAVIVAVIFYYVSISRGIEEDGFFRSIILYISGCVPLLDQKLTAIIQNGTYTYGGTFFLGILRLVFTLLENLGFSYPSFITAIEALTNAEQTVFIGNNIRMNAFVSQFFYFFLDGGYFTVILESFIYGLFSNTIYTKMRKGVNHKNIIRYAIVFQSILFSMVRFQFILPNYVIAFVLIQLLFRREKNEHISSDAVG